MELRHYLRLMAVHKLLIVVITVVAVLGTLAGTYIISPTYSASALIQVLPEEQEPKALALRYGDQVNFPIMRDPTETLTQSVIQFITSRPVAEEVVRRLQLDKKEPPANLLEEIRASVKRVRNVVWDFVRYGEYKEKDDFDSATDEVQHSVSGKLVKSTYMFELVAKAKNPELAAKMANTATDIAIEKGVGLARQGAEENRQYLESQLKNREEAMRAARKDVSNLRESDGVLSSVEQATALVKTRQAALDLYDQTQAELKQTQVQLDEANRQLGETPREILSSSQLGDSSSTEDHTDQSSSTVSGSKISTTTTTTGSESSDTTSSSNQRGSSNTGSSSNTSGASGAGVTGSSTTGSEHSDSSQTTDGKQSSRGSSSTRTESAQDVPPQTSEGNQSGSRTTKTSSTSRATAPNPVYQNLEQTRFDLERQLQSLKVASDQMLDNIQAKDQDMDAWIKRDAQLSDLRFEETITNDAYVRLRGAVMDAIVYAYLPAKMLRIVQPAAAPLYPSQPLRGLYLLGALVGGLLVGISLAFLIEYYKMSIRTAAQAQTLLDLPVLVRVPKLPAKSSGHKPNGKGGNGHD